MSLENDDKTPASNEPAMPNADLLFAGGEPIEAENLGNLDYGNPADVPSAAAPTPETPPAPEAPPAAPAPVAEATPPAEPATPPAPEAKKPDIRIPKHRLDQEIARRKALEEELRRVRAQASVAPAKKSDPVADIKLDFGTRPKEMFDKALDGKLEDATSLFSDMVNTAVKEAVTKVTQDLTSNLDQKIEQGTRQVTQRTEEQQFIDRLEETFDFFNPQSETYDDFMAQETLAIRDAFLARGHAPVEALRQAAHYTIRMYKPELLEEPAAPEPVAATATPAAPAAPAAATPSPAAVQRNLAAAAAQPPALPKSSQDREEGKISLDNMSPEDFAALPEATRARLRGDYL